MSVKVLVERRVLAGNELVVWQMLRDLRSQALRHRGYLYGETWQALDNPRVFMVLSGWATRNHWEQWAQSDFRRKMEERLRPLLRRPSVVPLFDEATEPLPPQTKRRSRPKT